MVNLARSMCRTVPSPIPRDLIWSLQPINWLARIIGIELNVTEKRSTIHRFIFFTFGMLNLLLAGTWLCYEVSCSIGTEDGNRAKWKLVLTNTFQLAVPVVFFARILFRWKPVWKQAERMEEKLNYLSTFYHRLRRVSIALVTLIFIWVE